MTMTDLSLDDALIAGPLPPRNMASCSIVASCDSSQPHSAEAMRFGRSRKAAIWCDAVSMYSLLRIQHEYRDLSYFKIGALARGITSGASLWLRFVNSC